MALKDVLGPKEGKVDAERTHVYLGMKLEVADFEELCSLFGLSATTSPTSVFKTVLETACKAKGLN